jgi:excinuclease UvrABC ATPase subunit
VEQPLALLGRLVDAGKSVIIIEHHRPRPPVPGHDGGRIMFERLPADLVAARSTLTCKHLAAYLGT